MTSVFRFQLAWEATLSRYLAIGDIHGCLTALTTLVESIGLRDDDTVITLGDYVNRGPDSKGVLDWLIEFQKTGQLLALKGNHEVMLMNARMDDVYRRQLLGVGGKQTLASYANESLVDPQMEDIPDQHWQFLDNHLHRFFEIDSHFFVHANAYSDTDLQDQPDHMLFWEKYNDPSLHI